MRIMTSISIAAMAVSLGSCNSLTADQQAILFRVQQGAVMACGFMPTVETVLSLLGTAIPGGSGVSLAIKAICDAVAPTPPAGVAAAPPHTFGQTVQATTPDGKRVNGMFVR